MREWHVVFPLWPTLGPVLHWPQPTHLVLNFSTHLGVGLEEKAKWRVPWREFRPVKGGGLSRRGGPLWELHGERVKHGC